MSKKKRRLKPGVKKILELITVCAIFGGVVLAVVLTMVHKEKTKFVYKKSLDDVVLEVGNCDITLREISYYIIKQERQGNEMAMAYNKNRPTEYWGLYMNDEFKRSGYVSDLAKASIIDYCVRDNIYYMEAKKNGFELPAEEVTEILYDAGIMYQKQSERERKCGLSKEDYELIMVKEETAHKYMLKLATEEGGDTVKLITQKYDVGGYAYENMREYEYPVTVNKKIWDNIKVGYTTIN